MYNAILSLDGDPAEFDKLTAGNAAQGLTPGKIEWSGGQKAVAVLITCETYDARFRTDGGDPMATIGHMLYAGQSVKVTGVNGVKRFKFCNATAGSNAVLQVTYYF